MYVLTVLVLPHVSGNVALHLIKDKEGSGKGMIVRAQYP